MLKQVLKKRVKLQQKLHMKPTMEPGKMIRKAQKLPKRTKLGVAIRGLI